jgi:hypothetical protein
MINKFIGSHIIFFSLVLKIFLIQFMLLFSYNTVVFPLYNIMDRCIYTDQTGISQLFTPIIYVEGPAVFSSVPWLFGCFFLVLPGGFLGFS